MNSSPLVSVIIPAYNAEQFIAETLDSILSQTYVNREVIVVDDGSTDGTRKLVNRYGSQVQYFYQENSGGCASPRNAGMARSVGEFLCFMDSDDLMVSDRIQTQVEFMERWPGVGLVFSDYRNFSTEGAFAQSHFETCPYLSERLRGHGEVILDRPCRYLARENFGIASSFMARRSVIHDSGVFDTSLKSSEDFHFFYRLARMTDVGVLNRIGMERRLHGSNMSGNAERMMRECIRSYQMLHASEEDLVAKKWLSRWIARFWSGLARISADRGQYRDALRQEWRALRADMRVSRMYYSARAGVRTMALGLGVHKAEGH